MNIAFPDVCITPAVVPVPIPYPNISMSLMAIPTQFTTLLTAMPGHNLMTYVSVSMGDQAGVLLNPISGMFMGPTRHLLGSFTLLMGGLPAKKMLMPSGQNGVSPGAFGIGISPSQVTMMVLS